MLSKGDVIYCEWRGVLHKRTVERVSGTQAYSGYQKFRRVPMRSGQLLPLGGDQVSLDIKYWTETPSLKKQFVKQQAKKRPIPMQPFFSLSVPRAV